MLVKRADQQEWTSAGYLGAERALLRATKEDGRTYIVRLKAGARGFQHRHAAGEDVLVLSGKIRLAAEVLGPGDYMYTEPGEEHFLEAIEDSVIFASTPKPVVITEKPAVAAEKV
jgi:quercetin dioxygenase-like cupin family protein